MMMKDASFQCRILAAALVALYVAVALAVAIVIYLFLYHNFVPIIAFHRPLYFDFTYVDAHGDGDGTRISTARVHGTDAMSL